MRHKETYYHDNTFIVRKGTVLLRFRKTIPLLSSNYVLYIFLGESYFKSIKKSTNPVPSGISNFLRKR